MKLSEWGLTRHAPRKATKDKSGKRKGRQQQDDDEDESDSDTTVGGSPRNADGVDDLPVLPTVEPLMSVSHTPIDPTLNILEGSQE